MNASIAKARVLACTCIEKSSSVFIGDDHFGAELFGGTAVEIYINLIRADECSLSDDDERKERQRFQREAIVGCRVLTGLLDYFYDDEEREELCRSVSEVRRLSAAWLRGEKRQADQKGAGK